MDAPRPAHLPRETRQAPCPSCRGELADARRLRCPRCQSAHHLECAWEQSTCSSCGYDLEDETRRVSTLWVERSARWLARLPGRWAERDRDGLRLQRSTYGSLLVSSLLLTVVAFTALWLLLPQVLYVA